MEIRDKYKVDLCFYLPKEVRKELSRPYGILFKSTEKLLKYADNFERIITVGDVVTQELLKNNRRVFLSIVDGKTKRNIKLHMRFSNYIMVKNEPAIIRLSAMSYIRAALNSSFSSVIYVDGEEDLLVIPATLYGRDGDLVIYGQPNAGAVALEICEATKWRVNDIFSKFNVKKC
ncbi:GTP-dependent dephospho-CoA kinase family protein [Acidianus sp.]|uniref:GTP-dependent dephospho-CoA kinase family protein n=1 Tax=Acidianus sp. TaxID=1872104 RepID=UPI00397888CD